MLLDTVSIKYEPRMLIARNYANLKLQTAFELSKCICYKISVHTAKKVCARVLAL